MPLPIEPFLPEICQNLKQSESRFLILTAETAAGKSTAVPPALLKEFPKKILMLEPRRLAVLSIANRISETLCEKPGQTCGYRMHLESKISPGTRLEIITEAILTRRLQNDPTLDDVSVVIIDEFHERSIHADLALAFLKEAMELRDDLYVIVMSATIETERLSRYLGTTEKPAVVMSIPGRQFPVEIQYAGNISACTAICRQLGENSPCNQQTILVFFPGIADIRRCQNELREKGFPNNNTEVLVLHSSISFAEQQKVLEPQAQGVNRIILSSAISETSLTVPGVNLVIDTGYSRINKMNVSLGMERLVTETESQFSAAQRSGRAGRLGPGKCIRLWNKNDVLPVTTLPEILRSDITTLVLECAQWGITERTKLNWLDTPTAAAWNESVKLLKQLQALNTNGTISPTGSAILKLGLHPRLAAVALTGFPQACVEYSAYSKSSPEVKKRFVKDIEQRLSGIESNIKSTAPSLAMALLAGFPDRLARQTKTKGLFQFPSGRIAHLPKEQIEQNASLAEWIVAPEVDAGAKEGSIYSYHALSEKEAESFLQTRKRTQTVVTLENNRLLKSEDVCYGKIVLSSKKLPASAQDYGLAICNQVKNKGFDTLPLGEQTKNFLLRVEYAAQQKNLPNKADTTLLSESVEEWLLPFLAGKTKIDEKTIYDALYWYLDGAGTDKDVPTQITLPNGKKRKINYEWQSTRQDKTKLVIRPVLEIIIQQIFGCFETPKVLGMPVLLKLLSPARRPLQITDDLENFWNTTWSEICREMKGRYPKHNWNYQVAEKED